MNGMITTEDPTAQMDEILSELKAFEIRDAVKNVTCKKEQFYPAENGRFSVGMIDYGYKHNILNSLLERGCNVTLLPAYVTTQEVLAHEFDGIMLSNGPGNPNENTKIIAMLKELMQTNIPIFGICLGHQLLALANGASSVKLKYGHRGGNQPVKDLVKDRTYITSQNHGYAVDNDTLDPAVGEISHVNANDGTCEGIRYKNHPVWTVQFHPEASAGPHDSSYLFDEFVKRMEEHKHAAQK